MKTTYQYQIYVYRDGGLHFQTSNRHFGLAREEALELDCRYSVVFILRCPDVQMSANYAPRCWRVDGTIYKGLEPCSVLDMFPWIP